MLARLSFSVAVVAALAAIGIIADAAEAEADPPTPTPAAASIRVAAAADLAFAFKDVAAAFEKKTGTKVEVIYGSTGLLAKQIEQGAPYDVFAAANVSFVDDVTKAGACDAATKTLYAQGRIVLWSNKALKLAAPTELSALKDKRYVKIAIANPEHAPYGKAAQQALQKAGVWDAVKPKLVYGENIQQTLQFAQSGNAEVAVVALSLAMATPDGDWHLIDGKLHDDINQALVVCGKDARRTAAAKAFAAYVSSPDGRAIMKKAGFVLPGESTG